MKTRNTQSLFPLKDKNDYKSSVIYSGVRACGSRYISETKFNVEVIWDEHKNPIMSSELSKHRQRNINHCLYWLSFQILQKNVKTRKNLEASYITLWRTDLNEQKEFERLFFSEMVLHRAINNIMQTHKKKVQFFPSVCYIVFNCPWQLIMLDKKQKKCANVFI